MVACKLQADEFSFVLKDKETNKILEKAMMQMVKLPLRQSTIQKLILVIFNCIVEEEEKGDKPGAIYDDMKARDCSLVQLLVISCQQLSLCLLKVEMPLLRMTAFNNNGNTNFKPEVCCF